MYTVGYRRIFIIKEILSAQGHIERFFNERSGTDIDNFITYSFSWSQALFYLKV